MKRHPVPFGEYIPARAFFRLFSPYVDRLERDFVAGTDVGVLDVGGTAVGDVICFEVAYDGLVRDVVAAGARLVVVQTNNATFGRTHESVQQLAMSRMRAIEHGRAVVVVSTSGISAVVAPDGAVLARLEPFTRWSWTGPVAERSELTIATRLGSWPERLLVVLAVGALLSASWHDRAARRRRDAGAHPDLDASSGDVAPRILRPRDLTCQGGP